MGADNELAMPDRTALVDGVVVDLMTLAEGATLLRVSKSTMYRLVNARVLEHYRIPGGRMLVDRRQINELAMKSIVPAIADRLDVAS
jgi:excisionase family DNA binding protein